MKIPVVLSTVHVAISLDGRLSVDVDGNPHRGGELTLGRGELQAVLDEITTELDAPVRVEIREVDGTTYADIATPPPSREATPNIDLPTPAPEPGLHGHGFHPGEEVLLAYVVGAQTADATGHTALHLPPALVGRHGSKLLLVGMTSAAVAQIEQPA